MKKNINTLRQYAKLRKLPSTIKLGNIGNKTKTDLLKLSDLAIVSNERAYENRKGIYGVEHDNTTPLGKTYNQKHIDNFIIGIDCLNDFDNKSEWRFAELDPGSSIPMHLDDPYTYRFLVLLRGSHLFRCDTEIEMYTNDVYFINPAYKHSVTNNDPINTRIALLGKIEINENNTRILRARA
jgi:hypothetical protein